MSSVVWVPISSAVVFVEPVISAVVTWTRVPVSVGLGEIWNGAQGQRGQRAAACSASARGPAGTGDRVCCAPLPLVFTNSIQGRRPGQQRSALSGKTVPLGARRRRHGGVKGKQSGSALARRHRPQSIVAPLVVYKPAQVPQAPAPLWDPATAVLQPTAMLSGGGEIEQARAPANRVAMRSSIQAAVNAVASIARVPDVVKRRLQATVCIDTLRAHPFRFSDYFGMEAADAELLE